MAVSLVFCLYRVSVHEEVVTDSSPGFTLRAYNMSVIVSAPKAMVIQCRLLVAVGCQDQEQIFVLGPSANIDH